MRENYDVFILIFRWFESWSIYVYFLCLLVFKIKININKWIHETYFRLRVVLIIWHGMEEHRGENNTSLWPSYHCRLTSTVPTSARGCQKKIFHVALAGQVKNTHLIIQRSVANKWGTLGLTNSQTTAGRSAKRKAYFPAFAGNITRRRRCAGLRPN
jgi:hypothetical protein